MISEIYTPTVVGQGSPDLDLTNAELRAIVELALQNIKPGTRVLAIIPDKTRDDNTDILFPIAAEFLTRKNVAQFDALVAQGTHPPLTETQKRAKIEEVIGRIETPTRHMIEAAAALVPAEVISFTSVSTRDSERLRTHALFAGDIRQALRSAAAVSQQVHIKYTGRKYQRVVALL